MKLVLIQPAEPYAGDPMGRIGRLVDEAAPDVGTDDVLLLPEHVLPFGPREPYLESVRNVAERTGCHVVGGSFHEDRAGGAVNAGVVVSPSGEIVGEYEKLRPYAAERTRVGPGERLGELTIAGRRVLVVICADFWFLDLFFSASHLPDLVLVPAFSVTRKPTPGYSRSLWRHLAVARAYELGLYVGISDWAYTQGASPPMTSGVAGFADPVTHDPEAFFTPVVEGGVTSFDLDFGALDAFRADRIARGFFWKTPDGS